MSDMTEDVGSSDEMRSIPDQNSLPEHLLLREEEVFKNDAELAADLAAESSSGETFVFPSCTLACF